MHAHQAASRDACTQLLVAQFYGNDLALSHAMLPCFGILFQSVGRETIVTIHTNPVLKHHRDDVSSSCRCQPLHIHEACHAVRPRLHKPVVQRDGWCWQHALGNARMDMPHDGDGGDDDDDDAIAAAAADADADDDGDDDGDDAADDVADADADAGHVLKVTTCIDHHT